MLKSLRSLFRSDPPPPSAEVPPGERVYAVGDIHGRLDLFEALIAAIEADDTARGPARTTIVLLGDLIDRGPDSAGVIAAARSLGSRRTVRYLMGNHEEMLLSALDSDEALRAFLRFGGRETMLSYVPDPQLYHTADLAAARVLARTYIPQEDIDFLRGFEDQIDIGDYHFVHAGVHPGSALDAQKKGDLRWIREPFLSHPHGFGAIVVHGHTITEEPDFRHNRIGLDTGAYRSGRLTALGLEGSTRWLIETVESEGQIAAATRSAQ